MSTTASSSAALRDKSFSTSDARDYEECWEPNRAASQSWAAFGATYRSYENDRGSLLSVDRLRTASRLVDDAVDEVVERPFACCTCCCAQRVLACIDSPRFRKARLCVDPQVYLYMGAATAEVLLIKSQDNFTSFPDLPFLVTIFLNLYCPFQALLLWRERRRMTFEALSDPDAECDVETLRLPWIWGPGILFGVLSVSKTVLKVVGVLAIDGSLYLLLRGTLTFWTMLFAWPILGEIPTASRIVSVLLQCASVVVVVCARCFPYPLPAPLSAPRSRSAARIRSGPGCATHARSLLQHRALALWCPPLPSLVRARVSAVGAIACILASNEFEEWSILTAKIRNPRAFFEGNFLQSPIFGVAATLLSTLLSAFNDVLADRILGAKRYKVEVKRNKRVLKFTVSVYQSLVPLAPCLLFMYLVGFLPGKGDDGDGDNDNEFQLIREAFIVNSVASGVLFFVLGLGLPVAKGVDRVLKYAIIDSYSAFLFQLVEGLRSAAGLVIMILLFEEQFKHVVWVIASIACAASAIVANQGGPYIEAWLWGKLGWAERCAAIQGGRACACCERSGGAKDVGLDGTTFRNISASLILPDGEDGDGGGERRDSSSSSTSSYHTLRVAEGDTGWARGNE